MILYLQNRKLTFSCWNCIFCLKVKKVSLGSQPYTFYSCLVMCIEEIYICVCVLEYYSTIQTERYKKKIGIKKMFDQDEGSIECAVGNREICFGRARKPDCF